MPQIAKGGKFVFGWSVIRADRTVQIPDPAVEEYQIAIDKKVFLISGSKSTGGFCVSRKELLDRSIMKGAFAANPGLDTCAIPEGKFVSYKGRHYCWLSITEEGRLKLTDDIMKTLNLSVGTKLLVIRGSDVAFVMGAKGRLIDVANQYSGEIELY